MAIMLKGPDTFYKCPKCGNILSKGSVIDGNPLVGTFFSDEKKLSPFDPEYPEIGKCKRCGNLLWLDESNIVGSDKKIILYNTRILLSQRARFIDIEDYFKALDLGMGYNREKEVYLRKQIWWEHNDRLLERGRMFKDKNDEIKWENNLKRLLELLIDEDPTEKIMKAEIYRNLGHFEDCQNVLKSYTFKENQWKLPQMLKECLEKKRWTFTYQEFYIEADITKCI